VAVVDVGSNSTRLFLCSGVGRDGPEGERETRVTGLRRGAGPDGTLAADALHRLDVCLAAFARRVAAFAPDAVLAIGTSAVREAPNREAVARIVRQRLGTVLRVVGGEEEAGLAFAGARLAAPDAGRVLVVDVGGGSTELVQGGPAGPERAVSLPLGVVRSTEAHLRSDPPREDELRALRAEAEALVGPPLRALPPSEAVIGVAGTATTLAAIALGGYDPRRVHRFRLSREEIEATTARLAAMPLAERRAVPGLHPDRAPSIVAGGLILAAVLRAAKADSVLVSERDLLDGAALRAGVDAHTLD
jgi:exopolyphosphatase/guanosine-5'-triphosphate,3'-diphosphate pyrophosphatase